VRRSAINFILSVTILLTLVPAPEVMGSDSSVISVRAVVTSPSFCWIIQPSATLDFGNLDPLNPVDVNAATTVTFRCLGFFGTVYFVGDDDGLNETGPNAPRMIHSTNPAWFLPYSFTIVNDAGTVPFLALQTLNITGTVQGVDYAGALKGTYTDAVTINIVP